MDEILNLIESVSERFIYLLLSAVILLFVGMCLSIFPFGVLDELWDLIRSGPEVSLLL